MYNFYGQLKVHKINGLTSEVLIHETGEHESCVNPENLEEGDVIDWHFNKDAEWVTEFIVAHSFG
jgi:NAD-dependent SIR2 family protein deacetylase